MPLSGAEKTRRYRDRLKKERPEEYAAQCKRNLQRMKTVKKKISEMSIEEAEEQRKKWRNEKRKSNIKKNNKKITQNNLNDECVQAITNSPKDVVLINKLRRKCKILVNKCTGYSNYCKKLKRQKETYKKRLQRLNDSNSKKIDNLESTILKMQAREEILESSLKMTYQNSTTHASKKILKKLVYNSKNKSYMSQMLGLVGKARERKKRNRIINNTEIINFYIRDDVSRNTAGRKETRTKHKVKKQIRYLLDSIVNLYKKYRSEGGRYGFTTFYKNKPFYVMSPHLHSRNTCLCIKHANFEFQHIALKKCGALKIGIKEALQQIACDINNYNCMYGKCQVCNNRKLMYEEYSSDENGINLNDISWFRWEQQDHIYTKKDVNGSRQVTTKKTAKVLKTGVVRDLKDCFDKDLIKFRVHNFNMKHQILQYQSAVSELNKNEVVIVCDFSENYEAKLATEIQSMHFGSSKKQITLHTGMVYWHNQCQSFCTISANNEHQPPAIWAHLKPLIRLIKDETPNVTVIHFYTDGPFSQYRQKNNFYLLTYFTKQYKLRYASWSFYESGHGKSVADGIGGCVKRLLDRKVCQGTDIANAQNVYDVLKHCLKSIKVFLIPEIVIQEITKILPKNIQPLKGTLHVHQVITQSDENTIKFRDVSCFCKPFRGQCNCYSPQTHHLIKKTNTSKRKPSNPAATTSTVAYNVPNELEPNRNLPVLEVGDTQTHCTFNKTLDQPAATTSTATYNVPIELNPNKNLPVLEVDDIQIHKTSANSSMNLLTELESFDASDMEALKNVVGMDNTEQSPDLMNIAVMPIIILEPDKEPTCTARRVVKRKNDSFSKKEKFRRCHKCTCSIPGRQAKCIACKNIYCEECVDGPIHFDYICEKCFED